jgi:hypothetical protein
MIAKSVVTGRGQGRTGVLMTQDRFVHVVGVDVMVGRRGRDDSPNVSTSAIPSRTGTAADQSVAFSLLYDSIDAHGIALLVIWSSRRIINTPLT